MIYPTYTHPGANSAMLRISQTHRRVVLHRRMLNSWLDTSLEPIAYRNLLSTTAENNEAWQALSRINTQQVPK